ncbi:MAG TPA: STAS/SEC14 domain-containing protein [Candidatus Limnocylindria bacterium]|jgi:hypothetical protein
MANVGHIHVRIDSQSEAGDEIVVVKVSGPADAASVRAVIIELEALAQQRGTLRILVDQTDMQPGLLGFNDIAEMVSDWRRAPGLRSSRFAFIASNPVIRGLNQLFRLSAKLEHKNSMNAFSKRADAVTWLVTEPTFASSG